jgi:hypothetical protein
MEKYFIGALAALFGWIVLSIPKIVSGEMTLVKTLAHVGLALMVGFISMSVTEAISGGVTENNLAAHTSISAVCGSMADDVIIVLQTTIIKIFKNKFLKKGE